MRKLGENQLWVTFLGLLFFWTRHFSHIPQPVGIDKLNQANGYRQSHLHSLAVDC